MEHSHTRTQYDVCIWFDILLEFQNPNWKIFNSISNFWGFPWQLYNLIRCDAMRCEFDRKLTLFFYIVVMFVELCHNMSYNPTSFDDFPRKKELWAINRHVPPHSHPKPYSIEVDSLWNRLLISYICVYGKWFLPIFFLPVQLKRDANYFVCASETERNKNLNW